MLRNTLKRLPWLRRKLIGSALSKIKPEDFVDVWFGAYVSERRTRFNEMEYHLPFEVGAKALREILSMMERDFRRSISRSRSAPSWPTRPGSARFIAAQPVRLPCITMRRKTPRPSSTPSSPFSANMTVGRIGAKCTV